MAIDKGLYQAPEGIAAMQEPPIEIEIVDPGTTKELGIVTNSDVDL
jgi:hypothetical protein